MLNLEFAHVRSGVQPTVENLPKTAMEMVDFGGGLFGRKMQKKNPPKNPPEYPPA